jgi:hypothetical protein
MNILHHQHFQMTPFVVFQAVVSYNLLSADDHGSTTRRALFMEESTDGEI